MPSSIWVSVVLKIETEKAWLVDAGIKKDTWVPKSQIIDYSENEFKIGDTIEIEIPEWLALEKELI